MAAMIAIVPAILNSFYTLSSVRGFVERRKMPTRPTYIGRRRAPLRVNRARSAEHADQTDSPRRAPVRERFGEGHHLLDGRHLHILRRNLRPDLGVLR